MLKPSKLIAGLSVKDAIRRKGASFLKQESQQRVQQKTEQKWQQKGQLRGQMQQKGQRRGSCPQTKVHTAEVKQRQDIPMLLDIAKPVIKITLSR